MPHEIDMSHNRANMAWAGQPPWHGLGMQLKRGSTIEEWQESAGLNWRARTAPVLYQAEDGDGEKADTATGRVVGRHVLYRDDTGAALNIISDRYQPVQPYQVMGFFRELTDVHYPSFVMETAGSLKGGARVWALARHAEGATIVGDSLNRVLLMATSFDGSMPTIVQQTAVRVVCQNTLGMAVTGSRDAIRVPHNAAFDPSTIKARMGLLTEQGLDTEWNSFTAGVGALSNQTVDDQKAEGFFERLFFPRSVKERDSYSESAAEKHIDTMMEYFHGGAPGSLHRSAQGTAWGLLNAVTWHYDHAVQAKKRENRLIRAWFGDGATKKKEAYHQALALVEDLPYELRIERIS